MFCDLQGGYSLTVDKRGLVALRAPDQQLLVRDGALHEFLDLSSRVRGADPDGDRQRQVHHHIQLYRDAEVHRVDHREGCTVTIRGELATAEGLAGLMAFETVLRVNLRDATVQLDVTRRYLAAVAWAGDDSICFLSPGGFARTFHVYSPEGGYETRTDGEPAFSPVQNAPHGPFATCIPRRLRAPMAHGGYGVIMGDGVGFGLIVLGYDVPNGGMERQKGQFRATRPRPPAEQKFDELEFQWAL